MLAHARLFLDGRVPAFFSVKELPNPEQHRALANLFARAAGGEAKSRLSLAMVMREETLDEELRLLEGYRDPIVVRTFVSEPLDRAAWWYTAVDLESGRSETVVLYLSRRDGRWSVTERMRGYVSVKTFLKGVLK